MGASVPLIEESSITNNSPPAFGGSNTDASLDQLNVIVLSWVLTVTHALSFFQTQSLTSVA